jgi:hypothetical protein
MFFLKHFSLSLSLFVIQKLLEKLRDIVYPDSALLDDAFPTLSTPSSSSTLSLALPSRDAVHDTLHVFLPFFPLSHFRKEGVP